MVDKGEKLLELAYTALLEFSIKHLSPGANAVLTLFPWNKSNALAAWPLVAGESCFQR